MNPIERSRRIWQKSIEKFHPVGALPFLGGVAVANAVLRKDLNEVVDFGLQIGAGVFAHNKFHEVMGTEVTLHNPDDEQGIIEWRVKQPAPHTQDSEAA